MRALFCGSRTWGETWGDAERIRVTMVALNPSCVISGGAPGADTISYECAVELGIETEVYPANWREYGRAAGPIRNKQMIVEGKPDVVVAFSHDITNSKGTANMVKQAEKAGIKVMVIDR